MKKLLIALCIGLLMLSCSESKEFNPEEYQIKSRKEIRATWDQFIQAWEAEDAKKLMTFYTIDGINIPPNSDIKMGRASIQEFYETLFGMNIRSDYEHSIDQIQIIDQHAIEQGHFQVNWVRNDSTDWVFDARSMTHWIKDQDGDWKIQEFMFNQAASQNE
ncbi:MAG: SgcJ/EcaC family oxidoreductase [Bacteroidia bacterium]|nr:SgcJ/EcaC family oxidoreductase [Bacteroidia bacterium]